MKTPQISMQRVAVVQLIVGLALVGSFAAGSPASKQHLLSNFGGAHFAPVVPVPRETPLIVEPLYDDPEVVSDEELAAVLAKVQPVFSSERRKPNFVEHALRTWRLNAKFDNPKAMSGEAMKEFLTDHGQYLASWGDKIPPLLQEKPDGVAIRWGKEEGGSVHHDHWLACLTEAGVGLHEPVFTPKHRREIANVLQQSLRDFRLDEAEVEWSAMAFGLWIAPQKTWTSADGRELSFDLLAERLMRGYRRYGVCYGTHRVYSLMVLVRLDDEHDILSDATREKVMNHLRSVRDSIMACQFEDGHWPGNWADGAAALDNPEEEDFSKKVIATGHHLEWLAIAPTELHPPREMILKAADWCIRTTKAQSASEISARYTFFSHIGNALALWRKTHPAEFWMTWEAEHPGFAAESATAGSEVEAATPASVDH